MLASGGLLPGFSSLHAYRTSPEEKQETVTQVLPEEWYWVTGGRDVPLGTFWIWSYEETSQQHHWEPVVGEHQLDGARGWEFHHQPTAAAPLLVLPNAPASAKGVNFYITLPKSTEHRQSHLATELANRALGEMWTCLLKRGTLTQPCSPPCSVCVLFSRSLRWSLTENRHPALPTPLPLIPLPLRHCGHSEWFTCLLSISALGQKRSDSVLLTAVSLQLMGTGT